MNQNDIDSALQDIERVVDSMEEQKVSVISADGVMDKLELDTPMPQLKTLVKEYLHQRYDPVARAEALYKDPAERAAAMQRHADALAAEGRSRELS